MKLMLMQKQIMVWTPLILASRYSSTDSRTIKLLLEHGPTKDDVTSAYKSVLNSKNDNDDVYDTIKIFKTYCNNNDIVL